MARKNFEELNLSNAFLFAAALQDEEICQMILEIILGMPVSGVTVHVEHTLLYSSDFRSVRLDVYARDDVEVTYNLEMENWNKDQLPKRSRFHQAEMDVAGLKPGEDFSNLKPSYVIFICTYDPFGHGLYRYTFENRCVERDFRLGDESWRIFLNTKGNNAGEVPELLVKFLQYVEDSSDACVARVSDRRIESLHEKICGLKKSRAWEAKYMTVEEYIRKAEERARQNGMQDGKREGIQQGQQRLLQLIEAMSDSEDASRIPDLAKDEVFLEQMYQKYHI